MNEPLLAGQEQQPKTLDQLIEDVGVAGAKKFSRWHPFKRRAAKKELRAAIDALKARWMSNQRLADVSGREVEQLHSVLDVMEQHFSEKDLLDVLTYVQGSEHDQVMPWTVYIRASAPEHSEFEKNRPNIRSATQKIERELFQQVEFDIREDTTAAAVIRKMEDLLARGLTLQSRDKKGSTVLHKVLEQLNPEMPSVTMPSGEIPNEVLVLFQFLRDPGSGRVGADFNAQNKYGNTPLHIAARRRLAVLGEGELMGGAIKILCEEFGSAPEIANNALRTPFVPGNPSERYAVRIDEYFTYRNSHLHTAIETRNLNAFEAYIRQVRQNAGYYARSFASDHPKFGSPIFYLQKLISDYENEKRVHSPREWYRQRKLKQMMEFYLENLARKIRADFALLRGDPRSSADANLITEMSVLSPENQNIVIRGMFIVYDRTAPNMEAVRKRYLDVASPAPVDPDPVEANAGNNNNNTVVSSAAPVSVSQVPPKHLAFQYPPSEPVPQADATADKAKSTAPSLSRKSKE